MLIGTTMAMLSEMADYATVGWNGVSVARIAKLLTDSFWMLRFDELVYVLKKGINGGYGKIYGTIQYVELARWMNEYIYGEREQAEQAFRDNRQTQLISEYSNLPEDKEQAAKFSEFVNQVVLNMQAKEAPPVNAKPALTREHLDDQNWTLFVTNKDLMKDEDLRHMKLGAEKSGYVKTLSAVEKEIERRATV